MGSGTSNIMKYEHPNSSVALFSTSRNKVHILVEDAVYDFVEDDQGNIYDVFRHVLPSMDHFFFVEVKTIFINILYQIIFLKLYITKT